MKNILIHNNKFIEYTNITEYLPSESNSSSANSLIINGSVKLGIVDSQLYINGNKSDLPQNFRIGVSTVRGNDMKLLLMSKERSSTTRSYSLTNTLLSPPIETNVSDNRIYTVTQSGSSINYELNSYPFVTNEYMSMGSKLAIKTYNCIIVVDFYDNSVQVLNTSNYKIIDSIYLDRLVVLSLYISDSDAYMLTSKGLIHLNSLTYVTTYSQELRLGGQRDIINIQSIHPDNDIYLPTVIDDRLDNKLSFKDPDNTPIHKISIGGSTIWDRNIQRWIDKYSKINLEYFLGNYIKSELYKFSESKSLKSYIDDKSTNIYPSSDQGKALIVGDNGEPQPKVITYSMISGTPNISTQGYKVLNNKEYESLTDNGIYLVKNMRSTESSDIPSEGLLVIADRGGAGKYMMLIHSQGVAYRLISGPGSRRWSTIVDMESMITDHQVLDSVKQQLLTINTFINSTNSNIERLSSSIETVNNKLTRVLSTGNPGDILTKISDSEVGFRSANSISDSDKKIYGIVIDTNNSNPERSVTYTNDAIGLTPMSVSGEVINYGSWESIIKYELGITPCQLSKEGSVISYLNHENMRKLYNSNTDAPLLSDSSSRMIEFPRMYIKVSQEGSNIHIKLSKTKYDGFYDPVGNFYHGYHCYGLATFNIVRILFMILFKTLDSSKIFGSGYYLSGSNVPSDYESFNNIHKSNKVFRFLGIKNPYGICNQLLLDTSILSHNRTKNLVIGIDGRLPTSMENEDIVYKELPEWYLSSDRYVTTVETEPRFEFLPITNPGLYKSGGSTSTYYCDLFKRKGDMSSTQQLYLSLPPSDSAITGLFSTIVSRDTMSYSSRLVFYDRYKNKLYIGSEFLGISSDYPISDPSRTPYINTNISNMIAVLKTSFKKINDGIGVRSSSSSIVNNSTTSTSTRGSDSGSILPPRSSSGGPRFGGGGTPERPNPGSSSSM